MPIRMVQGPLFGSVVADESLWTLEDSNQLRMALVKTTRTPVCEAHTIHTHHRGQLPGGVGRRLGSNGSAPSQQCL